MNISNLPYIMIKCILCTIIIVVVMAFILRVRDKKDYLNIMLVNIITNPIVVSLPIFIYVKYWYKEYIISLITLELLTVLTEGLIYLKVLKYKRINPILLSLILNASSYLIGEVINKL